MPFPTKSHSSNQYQIVGVRRSSTVLNPVPGWDDLRSRSPKTCHGHVGSDTCPSAPPGSSPSRSWTSGSVSMISGRGFGLLTFDSARNSIFHFHHSWKYQKIIDAGININKVTVRCLFVCPPSKHRFSSFQVFCLWVTILKTFFWWVTLLQTFCLCVILFKTFCLFSNTYYKCCN